MTNEEKQLLLKDLCARLPYGVIVQYKQKTFAPCGEYTVDTKIEIDEMLQHRLKLLDFKPYLRPMSSMTEEEKVKYCDLQDKFLLNLQYPVTDAYELFDWLNTHHFDFRNLIPMGLGIDCTGLNIYENEKSI